jgi:uncharacterized protein (DUF4415 family)
MTAKKRSTPTTWHDPDDAAELTVEFFESADLYKGNKLQTRGRPKAATTKEPVKIRLDADVLAALRASGDGWQTRINDTLRASLRLAGRV